MKRWYQVLYGVLIGLLASGGILLISQRTPGIPITLAPAPTATLTPLPKPTATSTPIRVQIGGEVLNPGIYTLKPQARLGDLIVIAGGLTEGADQDRINFAALLHNGDYFFIPAHEESIPETARNAPVNLITNGNLIFDYPINLNEASQEALESLPGIGPEKAADILAYKESIGQFSSIEDLLNVPGIGQKTVDSLKEYLVIEP